MVYYIAIFVIKYFAEYVNIKKFINSSENIIRK